MSSGVKQGKDFGIDYELKGLTLIRTESWYIYLFLDFWHYHFPSFHYQIRGFLDRLFECNDTIVKCIFLIIL